FSDRLQIEGVITHHAAMTHPQLETSSLTRPRRRPAERDGEGSVSTAQPMMINEEARSKQREERRERKKERRGKREGGGDRVCERSV
ncbi:hypothetical protein DPZ17_27445, partial [Klebsiella pneumoniae]